MIAVTSVSEGIFYTMKSGIVSCESENMACHLWLPPSPTHANHGQLAFRDESASRDVKKQAFAMKKPLNFIRISGLKYPLACWCYLWIVSVWTRPERQNVLHLCEISHPCSYVPPEWRKHHIVQNISPLLWCCIHPLTLKVTRCDHFYLRHPIHHYVAWRSPICPSCSNLCFLGYV